ncbi:DUF413 domain-containing protein [Aliivibrio fischeri]|nr:DUF413 domain-containing protein [Aliivibrio fischeri]MUK61882.1 DUF413 domain-containing protein [Aliivibrio fischeri]MUK69318.1 DUF413 domain-containing protein [Aliivibrio fischeri]MUK75117.1 DUF413 domain-containing protein [Aliivibrio fischeri]MUK75369.1 DUF413 domain-containing protein [Aliivibrio fischeri]MUL21847.1 DUF413 domain-containing protein [Aliivibrio fischeri]
MYNVTALNYIYVFCGHEEASMRTLTKFYDDKNFKRGFSRSGFTIREALILETYGRTMQSLLDGTLAPESEAEIRFVEQIQHLPAETSEFAQCWLKYQNKINFKPRFHTLCGTQRSSDSSDDDDSGSADDDTE